MPRQSSNTFPSRNHPAPLWGSDLIPAVRGWSLLMLALLLISALLLGPGCSRAGDGAADPEAGAGAGAATGTDTAALPSADADSTAVPGADVDSTTLLAADADSAAVLAADADSTAVLAADADSAAVLAAGADSTATATKKSFFANLFGRGGDKGKTQEKESVPVELATVIVKDMPAYLGTTATLEPEKQADVLAKIAGQIEGILVEEGDWVRQDQVLAQLDGKAQQVALEEQAARCRALELDLQRVTHLFDQDLASEKDLHDARYAWEGAQAQKKAAELQLTYTQVRAPFAGIVAQRQVDPGQTVAVGTTLFTIVDPTPLLARIHLPERQAQRIVPGQSVVISPDTDADARVPGQVVRISPVVDARTGTVKVTCEVDANDYRLRPGSFVRVDVQTDLRPHVLVIPKRALLAEGAEMFVFRAAADTVSQIPVTTGLTNHTHIQVTAGLEEGDRVVTVGHGALKTGARIREIIERRDAVADSSPGL